MTAATSSIAFPIRTNLQRKILEPMKSKQSFLRVATTALIGAAAAAQAASPPAEIAIDGDKIFPESMTSAPDGSVIFGSIGQHAIYRAKPGSGTADVWIAPDTGGL